MVVVSFLLIIRLLLVSLLLYTFNFIDITAIFVMLEIEYKSVLIFAFIGVLIFAFIGVLIFAFIGTCGEVSRRQG